jgi:hypothetical protein
MNSMPGCHFTGHWVGDGQNKNQKIIPAPIVVWVTGGSLTKCRSDSRPALFPDIYKGSLDSAAIC